ncbi:NUDIX domain-containing protein [Kribbella sp. VKM Ac-2527]|uniref:NUDIX domain-containing protein n=1 Tax=Kribbella caucasensis TaxID=2512215 RepID=A0A4R6KGI7_9ACTN|nr:NUDIX domain-containing protein [Kribbella sp. VKM Ac-2527]TDO49141.1 NUDIX domain-containing protein [Kribbella sp. VKM Ac-2527]
MPPPAKHHRNYTHPTDSSGDLPTVRKAAAFVTRDRKLLVFRKPHHPGTGTQVPAGTVEPGETPEAAVVREAEEETGLTGFTLLGLLDHHVVDMRPYGRRELHDRWCYHLLAPADAPIAWRHGESDPSSGPDPYNPYDFSWLDLTRAPDHLRTEDHPALSALGEP